MKVLFLAPLKAPDDPVPSGERTTARLFMKLLAGLGYEVELASRLRTYVPRPEPAEWQKLATTAQDEIGRLLSSVDRKDVACVFTYHVYYKAPDLIGSALASTLGIPYVIAEASRAPKRAAGPYARGHELSEAAIARAGLVLTPTAADRVMLERLRPAHQRVVDLKPFVDLSEWPLAGPRTAGPRAVPRLVTVAMMRDGDKLASYRQLAAVMGRLIDRSWTLTIVGDGPMRGVVADLFAPFGERVRLIGAVSERVALGRLLAGADLFVWPGVNEAFGAVFLEAQAHGLPCLAGSYGGIADVVCDGRTGLLSAPGDIAGLAASLASLLDDPQRRAAMGAQAARFIAEERNMSVARDAVAAAFATTGISIPGERQ